MSIGLSGPLDDRQGKVLKRFEQTLGRRSGRFAPGIAGIKSGQLRLFSFAPKRTNEISKIILESFDRPAAPTFVALTAQLSEQAR